MLCSGWFIAGRVIHAKKFPLYENIIILNIYYAEIDQLAGTDISQINFQLQGLYSQKGVNKTKTITQWRSANIQKSESF